MSAWTPVVTVTIGGTDYTGNTVDTVQLIRGRRTIYDNISASVASITLFDFDGTGIIPTVGANVTITLENSAGTPVTLFVGQVSDFKTSIYDAGIANTPAAQISIQAVSNLAKMLYRTVFRRPFTDAYGPQLDGQRITEVLEQAGFVTWEEAAGNWEDQTTTWADYGDIFELDVIDPGIFTFEGLPIDDAGYNASSQLTTTAAFALGNVYETRDGKIGYADINRRFNNATAGYLLIDSDVVTANSLQTSASVSDILNVITIQNEPDETQVDRASVATFGRRQQTINPPFLSVFNVLDKVLLAQSILTQRSQPRIEFENVVIRLDQDLDNTLRNNLIEIEVNDAVEIDNLPVTLGLTDFEGFVEGVNFTIDPFRTSLQLFISDKDLSLV
jgi:hypothetical protein